MTGILLTDGEMAALVARLGVGNLCTRGVLLVDDEPLNLQALSGWFEGEWQVHEAGSGEEALEIASRAELDVVVADQRMPGMSGIELLETLRARRPDLAGIVLTGYADLQALESAINRANAFHFLRKPCEPSELLHVVERASAFVGQRRTVERLVRQLADRNDALSDSLARLEAQQKVMLELERLGTMGQLTAGVTHDLRNVMVALRAAEWEISQSEVAPVLREVMQAGMAGVDSLLNTLRTLHEYARRGGLALELATVDPAVVVKDALAISRMDVIFRQRDVASDVQLPLPTVQGDRQKLTQVMVNLIRNALRATDARAAVRVSARTLPGSELELAVEDQGPGVPPELRARLFQPFVSGSGPEGLGLGLYMARLIVESHHGRIGVVDRAGGGARFEVVLPATTAFQAT